MSTDRPNVLLILTDQHHPRISGYAGHEIAETPHLDRLAGSAHDFRAAYCQSPLCVPARMCLLTGRTVIGCGAWGNYSALDSANATLPGHLSAHGYTTALVGKMHFTDQDMLHGFDHRPYGDLVGSPASHQPDPLHTHRDKKWTDHNVGRFPWAGESEIPESLLQERVVTRETLSYLLEHQDTAPDKPWFVCASYSRPHYPLTAPGRFFRKYIRKEFDLPSLPDGYPENLHPHDRHIIDDFNLLMFSEREHRRALAGYFACVDFVDDCIGELLNGMRHAGLLDNCLVIYTSDHGDLAGDHGLWWKRSYYDGSAGVPLLISAPDAHASDRHEMPVEHVDLFPTICDYCEVPAPDGLDGQSLRPVLRGEAAGSRERKAFARSALVDKSSTSFRMIRTARYKYVTFEIGAPLLFDMQNDPDETQNLAGIREYADICSEHQHRLDAQGDWDAHKQAKQRDAERTRSQKGRKQPASPNQYMLADGRIVHIDAQLYTA